NGEAVRFESADVAGAIEGAGNAALIGCGQRNGGWRRWHERGGIEGRAARKQGERLRRSAVIGQGRQERRLARQVDVVDVSGTEILEQVEAVGRDRSLVIKDQIGSEQRRRGVYGGKARGVI